MDRETNSVMEWKTEGRMRLFTALGSIEELVLQEIDDGEQRW